jgi:sec-independent protein translocase protein TatA
MPNVGPLEIVIVVVIALIVLGPRRLPDFGRSVGRGLREFRSALRAEDPDEEHLPPPPDLAEDVDEDEDKRERELAERERLVEERERELARRNL